MKIATLALLSATLALCGCSHEGFQRDPAPRSEKEVLMALAAVQATEDQRRQVLAAFDESEPTARQMREEREALEETFEKLSPRAPDYLERADEIGRKWGELHSREVVAYAQFEHTVATALTDEQWAKWQAFAPAGPGNRMHGGGGGRGRGRRGA